MQKAKAVSRRTRHMVWKSFCVRPAQRCFHSPARLSPWALNLLKSYPSLDFHPATYDIQPAFYIEGCGLCTVWFSGLETYTPECHVFTNTAAYTANTLLLGLLRRTAGANPSINFENSCLAAAGGLVAAALLMSWSIRGFSSSSSLSGAGVSSSFSNSGAFVSGSIVSFLTALRARFFSCSSSGSLKLASSALPIFFAGIFSPSLLCQDVPC